MKWTIPAFFSRTICHSAENLPDKSFEEHHKEINVMTWPLKLPRSQSDQAGNIISCCCRTEEHLLRSCGVPADLVAERDLHNIRHVHVVAHPDILWLF